jgi:hypothetical protein
MKVLASILFGVLVAAVVVAMKAATSETYAFLTPTVVVAVLASAFMGVFLEILKPSK